MFIVKSRNTFLPATLGAIVESKYRHCQQGEPALNNHFRMTKAEAEEFQRMMQAGETESKDIVAGRDTIYTITKD